MGSKQPHNIESGACPARETPERAPSHEVNITPPCRGRAAPVVVDGAAMAAEPVVYALARTVIDRRLTALAAAGLPNFRMLISGPFPAVSASAGHAARIHWADGIPLLGEALRRALPRDQEVRGITLRPAQRRE